MLVEMAEGLWEVVIAGHGENDAREAEDEVEEDGERGENGAKGDDRDKQAGVG